MKNKVLTLNIKLVVFMMPLEIESLTVPHLKVLNGSLVTCIGMAALLHCITSLQKVPISLHEKAKQWFHINVAVNIWKYKHIT